MNYRHQFHAGNFADAFKHVLLVQLLRALQRKEKGLLYLDTHAGRGRYDLTAESVGDSLARRPEWPDGVGRLWARAGLPPAVADYVSLVREFDRKQGNLEPEPRFYPGSPWLARMILRGVDRAAFCEKHPAEHGALQSEFGPAARVSVHAMDGYEALRAMLPPPERRGLVLIDPPFEAQDEWSQIANGLAEALRRFAGGVFALWYPLTERARVTEFFAAIQSLRPPPTVAVELAIVGEQAPVKLKGCGMMIVNPPWQFDREVAPAIDFLADALAQGPGGGARVDWIVAEK